jgi:hypothetical protein
MIQTGKELKAICLVGQGRGDDAAGGVEFVGGVEAGEQRVRIKVEE